MNRRPRVALIAYDYLPTLGGMGTYARALGRHMHECGYEVHLLTGEQCQQDPPLRVHPVLTGDLARDLPRLRRFDADIWHAVNFGYAPAALLKRPFVLTTHGTDFLSPWVTFRMDRMPLIWRTAGWLNSRPARRAVYGAALRCVDQVLTCSRFSARLLRREYPSVGPLAVVPNGVDEWFFVPQDGQGRPTRHPRRMLTVCKLDTGNRRKNVDGCLRAMAMVGDRLDLEYWIVGDGPQRPVLEQLARQLGLEHRVRFLGRVDNHELREAYASSSLFVLAPRPRRGDVEGFGIVYLEAAAAGTPSLATRCGGTVDAVADGQSGFFADDASPIAIAGAVERFFTGQVHFDETVVCQHAARHAWPIVLQPIERVYERLLGRRSVTTVCPKSGPVAHASGPETPSHAIRPGKAASTWLDWVRQPMRLEPRDEPPLTREQVKGPPKRLLLISYMFPPVGGSAVQRPTKLAKYLPETGWSVEVLTAGHGRFDWADSSLLGDIPADCRVHRVSGHEPACLAARLSAIVSRMGQGNQPSAHRHGHNGSPAWARWCEDRVYWRLLALSARMGMGGGARLWIGPAVRAAIRRHRRRAFDAVLSTGPPHIAHQVALRIARQTGLPWLADVRDPLVSDYDRTPQGRALVVAMRRLERAIMRHAAAIVTTCPSFRHDLLARYPRRNPREIVTITNGFDRDDLCCASDVVTESGPSNEDCVFVATGSFYGRRELARIVEPVQQVLDRHPEWQGRIRLVVAGTLDGQQRRRWERHRTEWLTLAGYLDHASAVRLAASAACAIVIVPDCRHGRLSIPGKTFELLALPTHLLALVPPDGDAARLAAGAGAATIARLEDPAGVATAIERITGDYFAGRLERSRRWEGLDRYDRRSIAVSFAECLDRATRPITSQRTCSQRRFRRKTNLPQASGETSTPPAKDRY